MPRPFIQNQRGILRVGRRQGPRPEPEFASRTINLSRVSRMVAGGRRFRFRAIVVSGDRKGKVGLGIAKGPDATEAVNRAQRRAEAALFRVPILGTTIPRDILVKEGSARLLMRPARPGQGIRAGGAVRAGGELAGIRDVTSKILSRSTNDLNNARAAIIALKRLSVRMPVIEARQGKK